MKIKKLTFKKVNRDDFLLYSLLAIIVFQSGTVQAAINASSLFFGVTRLIMMLIALYFSIRSFKIIERREKNIFIILAIALEFIAVINIVQYPKSYIELQYKIFLFLMLFLLFCWARKKDKRLDVLMYNVLLVIALVTLVMYIFIEIVQLPIPYTIPQAVLEKSTSFVYKNYFYLYYSYSTSFLPRMSGIFWEPGVNQIYLNLAILLYYVLEKRNIYQLIILIVSVLFTQSASGYMIMFVLVACIISRRLRARRWSKIILGTIIIVGGMICSAIVFYLKKEQTNFIGDSYAVRMHDMLLGISLFLEHPVFGIGFYNTEIFQALSYYASGNSNGLLTLLYTTGLVGLTFLIFPFVYKILFCTELANKSEVLLCLLFVVVINVVEPIYSLPIMMYILAREYSNIIHKN